MKESLLEARRIMIGKTILKFDTLDSTNEYIKKHALEFDQGTIVVAKVQTKGKGQYGNTWESPVGNLYFSILLRTKLSRESIFSYIMKTSISLVKLLSNHNVTATIKYPNDILINNKKISGILIESIGYEHLDAMVLGIGININQDHFNNLNYRATSMKLETNQITDIDSILEDFIRIYNHLDVSIDVHKQYLNSSILLNRSINYKGKEHIIKSINKQGDIVLECMGKLLTVRYDELPVESFYQFS